MIYRAGNWIRDGRTDQERKTPRFDYAVGEKVYVQPSLPCSGWGDDSACSANLKASVYLLDEKS